MYIEEDNESGFSTGEKVFPHMEKWEARKNS